MLHIHTGDAAAALMPQTGLPGKVMVWCDVLHQGPCPGDADEPTWYDARAAFLSQSTGGALSPEACRKRLVAQDRAVLGATSHEEICIWCDACLYDQLILARLLELFSRAPMDETLLTLVCVGEHFEFLRFIGLGQLDGSQLATEFEKRQPVTHGMYGLAVEAWQALLSPEPERLFRLAARPTGALPYLGEAVLRLLEEYPSLLNGLSRLEQQVMEAAVSGITHPGRLFQETQHMELRPFAGDTTLFGIVERLARAGRPLLTVEGPGPLPLWEPEALERWRIQPTELGYQIFSRQAHHAEVNGIDRWIGGVHLSDENLYLWDGASERIVRWGARQ